MCGIVGVCNLNGVPVEPRLLKSMTDVIAHRGPDGEGHYVDGPVGLGHRRLAVIDLSSSADQPMFNKDRSVVITYNGEVYNFKELRKVLQDLGYEFRSQSDTEVILHAYEEWGDRCVEQFNGMFAFAIYDRRGHRGNGAGEDSSRSRGRLFLARDRYGIKPLYYYHANGVFLFASEIKAILQHPQVKVRVDPHALSEYFTFQNIFTDITLFQGIRLLPPGSCISLEPGPEASLRERRYWDYHFSNAEMKMSQEECAEELLRLFDQAVTRQLVSDVPVGSYLSGGMDSGSITAVASRHIPRIHTFVGGFDLSSASGLELGFDERPTSEMMANLFKTEHYEVVLHAGDMENVLPDLIWHLEDLRVGQSYPNYYVARLASKFVKVVLSGGGGDELFAGYPWRYYRGTQSNGGDSYIQSYYEYWQRLIPDENRSKFFNASTFSELKDHRPLDVLRSVFDQGDLSLDTVEGVVNASLYFEIKTFLHGLFVVEDKLSMAHSLETRVPFMDNDLVDFAQKIPPRYKLRQLTLAPQVDENEQGKLKQYHNQPTADGKIVLREAMAKLMPKEIITRNKQGFSAPDASWFRGESINYVRSLLNDPKARTREYISSDYVSLIVDEHTSGRVNHRLLIWSLLSFEWWLRKFAD